MNETIQRIIDSPDDFLFTAKFLKEALAKLEAEKSEDDFCTWSIDDDGIFESSCELYWSLPEGNPEENGVNYCPKCGKKLKQHLPDAESRPEASK